MSYLDLDAFDSAPLALDPFEYTVVPGFVRADGLPALLGGFPEINGAGSFPAKVLDYGPEFAEFLDELSSEATARAFGEKFGIDLTGRPTMVTLRGQCRAGDGGIHTDSTTKLITALIYFNRDWTAETGRLRLLRSAHDMEDYAVEVPPDAGTLIAFRRSERSFHGHLPFAGERRSVQLNWVTTQSVARREILRHGIASRLKQLLTAR